MNEGDIREQIRQKLMEGRLPGRSSACTVPRSDR